MSVKAIRLENFMAFADTGWIELRPITLWSNCSTKWLAWVSE